MLNGCSSRPVAAGEDADLAGDLARGQIPDETHLACQAEAAGHCASDLRGDAERHRGRVRDEHRLDAACHPPARGRACACRPTESLVADDARGVDDELVLKPGAERLRQVCHPAEIGDAVSINPAEDLVRVEPLTAARLRAVSRARPARAQRGPAELNSCYLSRFLRDASTRL